MLEGLKRAEEEVKELVEDVVNETPEPVKEAVENLVEKEFLTLLTALSNHSGNTVIKAVATEILAARGLFVHDTGEAPSDATANVAGA